jgi:hypothetical protein
MNGQQVMAKINSALKFIKLGYPLIPKLQRCHSQQEATALEEDFKAVVKQRRRRLAKQLHPDLYEGKAAVVKAEQMKQVNAACDFLMSVHLTWEPVPPRPPVIRFAFDYGDATTSTSYTNGATTFYWRMG